ncbi:MAG: hypothetical protein WCH01_08375 [Methylococcaceae bacterium]
MKNLLSFPVGEGLLSTPMRQTAVSSEWLVNLEKRSFRGRQ